MIGYEAIRQRLGFARRCYRSIFQTSDPRRRSGSAIASCGYIKPDLLIIDDMGLRASQRPASICA
ncbi:MAG: hypothetical protein KF715_10730 [Candidatus Didemnitutus sp.]|nr:hypothetical protein [Candidatus Didemnitutus sp.]